MKKTDHSIYILFAISYVSHGANVGSDTVYWSSTYYTSDIAYGMRVNTTMSYIDPQYTGYYRRQDGIIRPVISVDYVDLGLPSKTLWAKGNIVQDNVNGGYKIGNETDSGAYVSWGNIVPHFSTDHSTFDDGYLFTPDEYESTPGASLANNIPSNDSAHDACLALLGAPWRLPTRNEFNELIQKTDCEMTTINGVAGVKFMKKTDHSVYIFLPRTGRGGKSGIGLYGTYFYYWTSSFNTSGLPLGSYFASSTSANTVPNIYRPGDYYGMSVRAVCKK